MNLPMSPNDGYGQDNLEEGRVAPLTTQMPDRTWRGLLITMDIL